MSKYIYNSEVFSVEEIRGDTFFRGGLKSEIEIHYFLHNGRLVSNIYTCGEIETDFISVDCGQLLGDILSYNVFLNDWFLDDNKMKSSNEWNVLAECFPNDLHVAKFDIHIQVDFNNLNEYLIFNWNLLNIDELRTLHFIDDFLGHCDAHNKKIELNFLDFFLTKEQIHPPETIYVDLNEINNKDETNLLEIDGYIYSKAMQYKFNDFDKYFTKDSSSFVRTTTVDSVAFLALSLLYEIIKHGQTLKKCKNCGRWFSPSKADGKYCSRVIDGVTCKQDAARKVRRETLAKKPYQKQYNSINTMLANRLKRKGLTEIEKGKLRYELFAFRDEALVFKEEIKNGTKTIEEFTEWLTSFKKGTKQ